MSEIHTLPLRLPKDLYETLKHTAAAKGRSVNAEIVECLKEMLPEFFNVIEQASAGMAGSPWITSKHEEKVEGALLRLVPELQGALIEEAQLLGKAQELKLAQSQALQPIQQQALMADRNGRTSPGEYQPGLEFSVLLPQDDPIGIQSLQTNLYLKSEAAGKQVTKLISKKRLEVRVRWRYIEDLIVSAQRSQVEVLDVGCGILPGSTSQTNSS